MGKTFLIIVLAVVVCWLWRRQQVAKPDTAAKTTVERPPELMVRCAHCGVNQPRSECVEGAIDGAIYCSEAHRREAESHAGRG